MALNRYSCSVECSRCSKRYKSSRATWRHMMKSHQLLITPVVFLNQNDSPVTVAKPQIIPFDSDEFERYNEWLVTVMERINEALHPALPGRWTRVEDPCVPEEFVLHFIARIGEQTEDVISPHSLTYLSHRGLPYRSRTQKVSYRVFDLLALQRALEEQKTVRLNQTAAFRHFEAVNQNQEKLTMKERIARMKASANVGYTERTAQLPTSRSTLVVSIGEGRSTREAEIIYWPNLYAVSKRCKFQLRFYVKKCDLQ